MKVPQGWKKNFQTWDISLKATELNLKIIKNNPEDNINDYAIIKDIEFSKVCDELFKQLWEQEEEILSSKHDEIIERISKALIYTELISD